jgi:hypothetical protein
LELRALALERRLAEERSERENLQEELGVVRAQLVTQAEHQASAVQRAEELVALEGELAATKARLAEVERERNAGLTRAAGPDERLKEALARAERAEAELARIDQPLAPLEPASRRIRPRTAAHREWSPQLRIAVVGTVLAALVVMLIVLVGLL